MIFGYLDPGSGSMILAAAAGGVAGMAVLGRLLWNRFLGLFSARRREAAERDREALLGIADHGGESQDP